MTDETNDNTTDQHKLEDVAGANDELQTLVDEAGANDMDQMSGPIMISCPEMEGPDVDQEAVSAYKFQIQAEIVSLLSAELSKREAWRRQYEVLWWNIYSLYVCGNRGGTTPTRSKIVIPIAFQLIEIATPKLISFLSGNNSMFEVQPNDVKDAPIADNIKRLIGDQLSQNNFSDVYENFVKQLLLYGTSYFYVDYKVKRDWVWERVPKATTTVDEFGVNHTDIEYVNQKTYKVVERRPNVSFLDILDVYPQQDHSRVEDQYPGTCVRRFMDIKEFERMCDGPNPYFGNKEEALKSGSSDRYQESRQLRKSARGENSTVASTDIELHEWAMRYDLDGDGIAEECQIIIANRQVVVRAVANPFYHQRRSLIKVCFCKVPGEWYGIGLIEPVMSLINQLITVRRQRLDNITMILNRMWKVKATSDIDPTKLVSTPNGIILVDDMGDIEGLNMPDVTQTSFQDANQILQDIFAATVPQSITGSMDDMKTGSIGIGAVKANIAQALEKFATAAKAIQDDGVKPVLEMFYSLDLQYLNTDEIIRAFYGKLFPQPDLVTPEMIRANVSFRMTVLSDMVNLDTKIAQNQAFYTIANLTLTPNTNQTLLRKIWKLMGNDPSEINVNGATQADGTGKIDMSSLNGTGSPVPLAPPAAPAPGIPAAPAAPGNPGAPLPPTPAASAAAGKAILSKAMAGDFAPTLKGVHPLPSSVGSE